MTRDHPPMGAAEPRTAAGRQLLRMFQTEERRGGIRWPRSFDARLAERIVEEFVPAIESEAALRYRDLGPDEGLPR